MVPFPKSLSTVEMAKLMKNIVLLMFQIVKGIHVGQQLNAHCVIKDILYKVDNALLKPLHDDLIYTFLHLILRCDNNVYVHLVSSLL